jgi:hypothetical protein
MRLNFKAIFNPVNASTSQAVARQSRGSAWQPAYLAFGIVDSHNSELATVSVKLSPFGLIRRDLQVMSREWAGGSASSGYGERDLPPVGAVVVVAFADADQNDGIVIGSVLMPWNETEMTRGQKATGLLATGKEDEALIVTSEGTKVTRSKTNGNITVDAKTGSALTLNANGAQVTIDAAGNVTILAPAGKNLTLNAGASTWLPNTVPVCPISGFVHGGAAGQPVPVTRLKGA